MEGVEENEEENGEVGTLTEVLDGIAAQHLEADLVLGGDEGKECTYQKGIMGRQAVFSCLTCTPAGNAGLCTACSLVCHDGHEVVELWTRRGFRCDCGNGKFEDFECKLFNDKEPENTSNVYNQNYAGLYCTCHRPFPDPEVSEPVEMLQCCICEDWFHETHLGLSASQEVPRDDDGEPVFDELICQSCISRCSFLSHYPELLVPPMDTSDVDDDVPLSGVQEEVLSASVVVNDGEPVQNPSDLITTGELSDPSGSNGDSSRSIPEESLVDEKLESFSIRNAFRGGVSSGGAIVCKLNRSGHALSSRLGSADKALFVNNIVSGQGAKPNQAIFLAKSWRTELCRCEDCLAMYTTKGVGYLMDREDTIQQYEETAQRKREELEQQQEGTCLDLVKNLGHVQKIELIKGFKNMTSELGAFVNQLGDSGKTVTPEDIYEFFGKLRQKRQRVN